MFDLNRRLVWAGASIALALVFATPAGIAPTGGAGVNVAGACVVMGAPPVLNCTGPVAVTITPADNCVISNVTWSSARVVDNPPVGNAANPPTVGPPVNNGNARTYAVFFPDTDTYSITVKWTVDCDKGHGMIAQISGSYTWRQTN